MAKGERRFVIVPREVLTDDRYAAVRADRCALGAWLLLYFEADAAWPLAPSLPRWLTDAELDVIAGCGLLVRDGEDRYRLPIVDASRAAAKRQAEGAAAARWDGVNDARADALSNAGSNAGSNAPRNAQAMLTPMPTQTQTETQTENGLRSRSGRSAGARRPSDRPTRVTGFTRPFGGENE